MGRFKIEVLDKSERESVMEATYALLECTGVKIFSENAVELMKKAGCDVQGNLVKIPRNLVKKCIASAPSSISVYDRNGNPAMELTGTNCYYGPGVTCPYFYDSYTMERKPATKQYVRDVAKVCDSLKNVDFLMSLCMIGDVTPAYADIQEVDAMMQNSTKPILTWAFGPENMEKIIEMAEVVAGGASALREKPYVMAFVEPTTPLVHVKEAMDKIILLAEKHVPCVYSPGMSLCGTAPATVAGGLIIGLADTLTGLVVSQLVSPGAPMILCANGGVLDMRTLQASYGNPEMCLLDACGTYILRELGIPTFGLAGATDAKALDMQAGFEGMMQIVNAAGIGANLVHDVGMMDMGMTGSIHYLVACDEMIGYARRLTQGVILDEDHFAADVIHEVGPGGNFVAEEHTVQFLREEVFMPELAPRISYEAWKKDNKKGMAERALEKTVKILKEYTPAPLEEEKRRKLQAIVDSL